MTTFAEPWRICNNCKQPFQNQLSIDLASAFISFAETACGHEENRKWDKMRMMTALRMKIEALSTDTLQTDTNEVIKEEMTMLINQLLDTIEQTKKDLNMNRWIHMPKTSEEYQYYTGLGGCEAYAHIMIATTLALTEEGTKVAIGHFKKARAIYNLAGKKDDIQQFNTMISAYIAEKKGTNNGDASTSTRPNSMLQSMKNEYKQNLETKGMNSDSTIFVGLQYAEALWQRNRRIEAERLAINVATASRQVHGPHHKITIKAKELLGMCTKRCVTLLPEMGTIFQALRYENGGEICVVTGSITKPRHKDDERMYHIANNLVIPGKGCAVMCRGLVSAST